MQNSKKANSPKNSKAKAGSAQPNVVIPQIQRPSEILKEENKRKLPDYLQAAAISLPMRGLIEAIDEYMDFYDPRETVGTLCDFMERTARLEAESEFPDVDSLHSIISPVTGIVQLLAAIHCYFPQAKK